MLKLFANQRKISAMLLRTCWPAAVSSSLRNTQNLKDCRRSMSDDHSSHSKKPTVVTLPLKSYDGSILDHANLKTEMEKPVPLVEGEYYAWSLTSNEGHSLMELQGNDSSVPITVKCSGTFNDRSGATVMETVDLSTPQSLRVALRFTSQGGTKYYLSARASGDKYVVETKDFHEVESTGNNERFIHWKHGSYSMFECQVFRNQFLGCSPENGSLVLVYVQNKPHPDPRVLFLLHLKGSN